MLREPIICEIVAQDFNIDHLLQITDYHRLNLGFPIFDTNQEQSNARSGARVVIHS